MAGARPKFAILERAMRGLVAVHAEGLSHCRPFLRDMTVDADDTLHFFDLGENPTAWMSLEDAQVSDVWWLLSFCTEFCEEPFKDFNHLLDIYFRNVRVIFRSICLRWAGRYAHIVGSYLCCASRM